MIYLRQSYKIKPQRWGSDLDVRASIFQNAERIGIDPAWFILSMPMWGLGSFQNYATNTQFTQGANVGQKENSLLFDGSNDSYLSAQGNTFQSNYVTVICHYTPISFAFGEGRVVSMDNGIARNWQLNGSSSSTVGQDPRFLIFISNSAYSVTISTVVKKEMNMVAGRFSDGSLACFFNKTKNTTSRAGVLDKDSPDLYIGKDGQYNTQKFNGLIHHINIFNKGVSDSQIFYFSDNPYFLLQRVAPVYYSVPSGAISVYSELISKFDIRNAINSELIGKFDIFNTVNSEAICKFDIRNNVSSELIAKYDTRSLVASEMISKFDILSGAVSVSSELVAKFDINNTVSSQLVGKFDIKNSVSSELISKFDIKAAVASELISKFDIRTLVNAELIAVFDMGGSVSSELIAVFDIDGLGGAGNMLVIGGKETAMSTNQGVFRIG